MWLRQIEGYNTEIPKRVFIKLVQEYYRDNIILFRDDTPWVLDGYARLIDWKRLLTSSPELGRIDDGPIPMAGNRMRWWLEGYTELRRK